VHPIRYKNRARILSGQQNYSPNKVFEIISGEHPRINLILIEESVGREQFLEAR